MQEKTYTEDITGILDLIASKNDKNISLAFELGKAIGIDIPMEIKPLLDISSESYPATKEDQTLEKFALLFLLVDQITLNLPPKCSYLKGLVFCQNIVDLTIDLKGQYCPTDFESLNVEILELENCAEWPLNDTAIEHLTRPNFKKLTISSADLAHNKSFIIPPSLGQFTSLMELYLQHPNIQQVPEELLELNALEYLRIYTKEKNLKVPNYLFESSNLKLLEVHTLPQNTIPYIGSNLQIVGLTFSYSPYWQLAVWKYCSRSNWHPSPEESTSVYVMKAIDMARNIASFFWKKDLTTIKSYRRKAAFMTLILLLLFPLLLLPFLIYSYFRLPELYKRTYQPSKRGNWVYKLAESVSEVPLISISETPPAGYFIFLIFLFSSVWPLTKRLIFPLVAFLVGILEVLVNVILSFIIVKK